MILARHLQSNSPWFSDFGRLLDTAFHRLGAPAERLRLLADDGGWTLELDLPGVKREAVSLESKDRQLILKIDQDGAFTTKQRYELPLAKQVDATGISASLADGVLKVRLPKRADSDDSQRIEIH